MGMGEDSYRRYLDGDESAFSELVELYFGELILFANGSLHDIRLAEEAALDALLELMIHPERFKFRSSLKTYLFSIARHKALNAVRKRKRLREVPLEAAAGIGEDRLIDDLIAQERRRVLMRALAELPEEQRAAVQLVYIEEMSYAEAGRVLKKSRKQIDNLLRRAKRELKIRLGEDRYDL